MELLGVFFGWLMSPFRDTDADIGFNRYWEDPDFEVEDNTTKEADDD